MLRRLDCTSRKTKISTGMGGVYIRLNKTQGVKLFSVSPWQELDNLRLMDKMCPGIFPRPYRLVQAKWDNEYRTGILMEHIVGKTLYEKEIALGAKCPIDWALDRNDPIEGQVYAFIARMEKAGLRWTDWHEDNIMINRYGQIRFIDIGTALRAL